MSSSKSLSISDLFFISPSSTIWLLLFFAHASRTDPSNVICFWTQPCSLSSWYLFLSCFHWCVEPLFCFWASAMAVEPSSSTEACLAWGPSVQATSIHLEDPFLVRVIPVATTWGTCHFLLHRTWCKVPPYCPILQRWLPRAGATPTDGRVT